MLRVFASLNNDYNTDADDVAFAYTEIARRDGSVAQTIRSSRSLASDFSASVEPLRSEISLPSTSGGGGGRRPSGIRTGSGVVSSSIGTGTAPVTKGVDSAEGSALRVLTRPV